MKYAIWRVSFKDGQSNGTTPDNLIRERGGQAQGMFEHGKHTIVGCFSEDSDITGLEEWLFQEITQTQALTIAKSYNPNSLIHDNGAIFAPFIKE